MIVTTVNKGVTFYLRGTTWTFNIDRASVFTSREAAETAVKKARMFMVPSIYAAIKYMERG